MDAFVITKVTAKTQREAAIRGSTLSPTAIIDIRFMIPEVDDITSEHVKLKRYPFAEILNFSHFSPTTVVPETWFIRRKLPVNLI